MSTDLEFLRARGDRYRIVVLALIGDCQDAEIVSWARAELERLG